MKRLYIYGLFGMLLCAVGLAPRFVWGQAATVGTVIGQVMDQSGAVVPGANVVLTDVATKATYGVFSNGAGRFVFSDVKPGTYDVAVTAKGFRKLTVTSQEVIVGQSLTLTLTLEVGATTQTVEVKAVPGADLQTLNSTVGTTLSGNILTLPNQNRDATSLLIFQPMTAPTFGGSESNVYGGQVAGAMSDQNTFTLDGGSATDDLSGDNYYVSSNRGYVGPQAAIPTPVESIEEFKVATNNQTADFSSSAGGQVMLVTKRGTDAWHGSAYDYFQANWLNARGWNLNSTYGANAPPNPPTGAVFPKQHQNRFGGSIGGPVLPSRWGGKTYFYGNYEGRRLPVYVNGRYEKSVPSALLRQGVIQEPDTAGQWLQYPLETSTACGSAGGSPCDPRGPNALSPAVMQLWSKYMPLPNDCPGAGDHYNTCGYFAPLTLTGRDDFTVGRLDHDFGAKWRAYASMRWYSLKYPSTNQVDIGGLMPGDTLGVPASQSSNPGNPRYYVVGLTGTLTPSVTNEFHISMIRNDWNYVRAGVPINVPGMPAAVAALPGGLEIGGETTGPLAPMNFDTQDARNRLWDGQDWSYSDSVNWLRGNHYLQLGGQFLHFHDIHERDDEVTAALTQLVYQVSSGNSDLLWTAPYYPLLCSSGVTTGCMLSSSRSSYEGFAAELMGIVSQGEQVFVRGGTNFALTGVPYMEDHSIINDYSLFINDSWKLKPNLTLNYGLEYGVSMPPYELNGLQDILTDAAGNATSFNGVLNTTASNALQGIAYNPVFGFTPIRGMGNGEKYPYAPFYGAFSPRVSVAYSPAVKTDNWVGKIFGNRKTVIRGGYVRIYDRLNQVGNVLTPLLGYGFGQPLRCVGMNMNDTCSNTTSSVNISNAFRLGVDGSTAPMPAAAPTLPVPAEPGVNTPGASVLFSLDSQYRPGTDDQFDFTIQRELPGQMIVEAGYNGRWAKHLYLGTNTDNVPVMLTLGGQSFTQAYYQLFLANQGGNKTIAAQPFFETALGGPTSAFCSGYANCSTGVLVKEGASGANNLTDYDPWGLFSDIDTNAYKVGTTASLWNFPSCVNCQILPSSQSHSGFNDDSTTNGFSNYQALFVTLQKRTGHGLVVSGNFTYSRVLDTIGINQEYVEDSPDFPWNLRYDYAPAPFDRTLVMNILAHYDLPFGKGKYFATTNPVLDRIIGGWSFSPVWTWGTGLPIETATGGNGQQLGAGEIPWGGGIVPLVNTASFGHTANLNLHTSGQTATYPGPSQGSYVGYSYDPYPDCGGNVCTANTYGVNLFKNPAAVFNSYRPLLLGVDTRAYPLGAYYGQHRYNVDFTLAKQTHIKERWNAAFYAQFLNAFNFMEFGDPGMNYFSPGSFGALTGQFNKPRVIELGLRLSF